MKRMLLWMLASFLCGSEAFAALDAKPKVRIDFAIEAAGIRTDLNMDVGSVTASLQTRVHSILQKQFPYFDWVTSGSADRILTITLKERQGNGDLETVLEYRSSSIPGDPIVHVLYEWLEPPPHDAQLLKDDLLGKNDDPGRIRADVLRSESNLKMYFASRVPLVRRVEVSQKHILLPVANVHPESGTFLVKFVDVATGQGRIQLFEPLDDRKKGVICRINNFNYTGDPEIDAPWHDSIPAVMKEKAINIEVIVQDFTPLANSNTSGGSVTSLPKGDRR